MTKRRDPLDKLLDGLFSEFIRKRAIKLVGGCERCLTPKYDMQKENGDTFPAWMRLQCSHFIGKGRKSTAWDIDNAAGLCGACHIYFTSNPSEHTEFFKRRLGEQGYDLLQARMRITYPKPDKESIRLYLQEQIRRLGRDE